MHRELQSYLQYAFDHFAQTLDEPFDFVQASFVTNPIPVDFGGSILRLAIGMIDARNDKLDAPTIFQQLSSMVASCIMVDSVRHPNQRYGSAFGRREAMLIFVGDAARIFPEYIEHLGNFALQEFSRPPPWPCEFTAFGIEYPTWLQHFDATTLPTGT